MAVPIPRRERRDEYWSWAAVALFLLLTIDLLTTIVAVELLGPDAEVNPIIRWAWSQGLPTLVAINLLALVLLAVLFYGLIRLTEEAPAPYDRVVATSFEVWIGLLIAAGLLVFANNLVVIVFGRDLVSILAGVR